MAATTLKWLTLELIKANSRIDGNEEDDLLTLYGESAEQQVLNDTGRTYAELVELGGGTSVPPDIKYASLMLADFAYQQRSPVDKMQWHVVPYTYERLIKPYVKLADDDEEA